MQQVYTGTDHQAEVEDAPNDIEAGVLEAEEVQVLAAQLHAAGGGGVGRHAVVLPTPPQLCLLRVFRLHSSCCTHTHRWTLCL